MNRFSTHDKFKLFETIAICAIAVLAIAIIVAVAIFSRGSGQIAVSPTPVLQVSLTPGMTSTPVPETPSPEPTAQASSAKIQLCGDILLHDTSRESGLKSDGTYDYNSYFETIKSALDGDLKMVNIEAPIDADGTGKNFSGYPSFNMPPQIVTAAQNAGFNFFITSNNHAADKGKTGIEQTIKNYKQMGVDFTGTYASQEEHDAPVVRDINGIKVGICAYTYDLNGRYTKAQAGYYVRMFDQNSKNQQHLDEMLKDVSDMRAAGAEFIIFYLHWGTEYVYSPSTVQRWYAQNLLDNGVDVIMGTHPHCVQPITKKTYEYNGVQKSSLVIYSLGNFFADQIRLSTEKQTDDRIRQSIMVNVYVEKGADGVVRLVNAEYVPIFIHRDVLGTLKYNYRILPAGEYAVASTRPTVFDSDDKWQLCKNAWENIRKVVGSEIPAVTR